MLRDITSLIPDTSHEGIKNLDVDFLAEPFISIGRLDLGGLIAIRPVGARKKVFVVTFSDNGEVDIFPVGAFSGVTPPGLSEFDSVTLSERGPKAITYNKLLKEIDALWDNDASYCNVNRGKVSDDVMEAFTEAQETAEENGDDYSEMDTALAVYLLQEGDIWPSWELMASYFFDEDGNLMLMAA